MNEELLSMVKGSARRVLPASVYFALRARGLGVESYVRGSGRFSASQMRELFTALQRVTDNVECGHGEQEILRLIAAIADVKGSPEGAVVECGCWKGGSSAKLSLAAKLANRKLYVFDSFQGIPPNDEGYTRNIHGDAVTFKEGDYTGTIDEVRRNVTQFGDISVTTLVPGWLDDTLPKFQEPVAVAYLDVDLVSSTMTCLKYLWPLMSPGGMIFSQDAHLTNVVDAMSDNVWWQREFGRNAPTIHGLGVDKLVYIVKDEKAS